VSYIHEAKQPKMLSNNVFTGVQITHTLHNNLQVQITSRDLNTLYQA